MEYRLLGPLEVVDGGRTVPLRGPRQRALLAALLVSANEVVPEAALLERLWGDEPPASGSSALRVRVSQLRKLVGDAIATRSPGYALLADPELIDARRFERLVGEGCRALADDPEAAASILRGALGLWRGPALVDVVPAPFAEAEAARLEELRLAALEHALEAELSLGRHAELVAELDALVAEMPLRESLRRLLMLALYRSGRQARALDVYRHGRARLVGELGIEPGGALRELEAAILRHDPALDLPGRPALDDEERKLVTILVAAPPGPGLEAEIAAAGGSVERTDARMLVAAFGAPLAQEGHAQAALSTALRLVGDGAVRVGVESGEVVVAPGGDRPRLAGTALQAAMRLAQAAGPGTILAGPRAVAATRRSFEFGPAGPASGRPLVRGVETPPPRGAFVGRRRELEQLVSAYRAAAADGSARLVTIVGDAGVGKSRLVDELWGVLGDEDPAPLRRSGRCLAHGRGLTYRPLADVVREHLGLLESDSEETIRARLGDREVLALTLGLDAPEGLHPLVARDELQREWVQLICELGDSAPPVLLIEDLHWAQEPLLDLLERLLDECTCALLLVCTARPEVTETRPTWGRRRDAQTIWLEPLAETEAEELLAGYEVGVPDELRVPILVRAEGNPFFLEELALTVARHGEPVSAIPDTVQAVLASRIDLLPPLEKAALQAAAVIGRVFWDGPVEALLDRASPDFALLQAGDFVRPRRASSLAGEKEYAFKHALTRDVAYASLPDERRRALHAGFAAWLEETGAGRDEYAVFLAHHFAEAEHPKAVAWLRRAAELAIGRYELEEALALLARALELDGTDEGRLGLYRLAGRANALKHDGAPFLVARTSAITLARDDAARAELYSDLSFETALRAGMWRKRPDRELVDGWIDLALELAEPGSPARARALIARCVWAPAGNAAAAREAGAIAEALGDPELISHALDAQGITAWVEGERAAGRAFEHRRFALLDRITDPDHVADIHYAPVSGCVWVGDFEEARRLAGEHDRITRSLTAHHRIHGVAVLVEVEELIGDWRRIRDSLAPRAEEDILANLETPCVRSPRSLTVLAVAEHVLGDEAKARRYEELADEFGMEGYGHVLETPRLRLALLRDDLDQVERLAFEPLPDRGWHRGWMLLSTESVRLDALARLGCRDELEAWAPEQPDTYLEPFRLRALGLVREDERLVAEALRQFDRLGLTWHAEQTRAAIRA
jgi:DNA-binding SARP family transcriptional activator